jgi:signal transduction histidine kinase
MLRRLRIQLTFLYLLAALGLVALLGGGSYSLLRLYMQNATDQALQVKMAIQFRQYGLSLPAELASAERDWLGSQNRNPTHSPPTPIPTTTPPTFVPASGGEDDQESGSTPLQSAPAQPTSHIPAGESESGGDAYDEQLGSVFVVPLDTQGQAIQAANQPPVMVVQDAQASANASANGSDLRTSQLPDGRRVRLLTYRSSVAGGPALLQVGRLLHEQDLVLQQFLDGLLVLAAISAVLLGLGSWWLSGRALKPAQRAWENQQAFVANASHELRAPLTLIKADAEVGLRAAPPAEQKEVLEDIVKESDYMNRLVDDLLLLSRLDTHRLKLTREAIDLKQLMSDIHRQVSKLAIEKDIEITLENSQGSITGDPVRMRQILLILIDNALRYTPPGGQITLETHPLGRRMQILIKDTGQGIPASDLPHIFERFYQVQYPGIEEPRGNGLGLSIAKALVEAQGGEIRITSQPGVGTLITLLLIS